MPVINARTAVASRGCHPVLGLPPRPSTYTPTTAASVAAITTAFTMTRRVRITIPHHPIRSPSPRRSSREAALIPRLLVHAVQQRLPRPKPAHVLLEQRPMPLLRQLRIRRGV